MPKSSYLLEHLSNGAFCDQRSPIALDTNPQRLCLDVRELGGGWRTVAGLIYEPFRWPVTWFPDANVAINRETQVVWDALRLAGLGAKGGVAALSTVVLGEIAEWLNAPRHDHDRARDIKAALDNGTWLTPIYLPPTCPFAAGVYGYMHLLGVRRLLARPIAGGPTFLGTSAADKSRTMNAIKDKIGLRAQGLAKEGRVRAEEKGVISVSDELHCVIVIAYALATGRNSVILTADEDYVEIFYKAQWFFDTHYRAWLAAKMVKDGWYGPPVRQVAATHGYFNGPLTLYRRPTEGLREVLPQTYEPVRVGVIYVAPDGHLLRMVSTFERRMLDMLQTRSDTDGRCTDHFGDANIHVDLGPLKPELGGLYLGIGRDKGITRESNVARNFVGHMDKVHALACNERHVRL